MSPLSPSVDTTIARTYGIDSLEQKVQNKTALQQELGWAEEPKRPMICLPAGMSEKLGGNLLKELLPGLMELPVEILILGKGSSSFGTYLTDIAREHNHRLAIIPNDDKAIGKMYAASDIALFLSNPDDTAELKNVLRYGVIPVAPSAAKILQTYNPNQESGNAFLFEKETVWLAFAAVVRSLETYRFPFDWRTIQKHAMESVK